MGRENREHIRIPCKVKVAYAFTSWKDQDLSSFEKPIYTESLDISIVGIGVCEMIKINNSLAKQLIRGKKKVKLSISLYEEQPPITLFARLIWLDLHKEIKDLSNRGGFKFLDISTVTYYKIKKFIEDHQKEAEKKSY